MRNETRTTSFRIQSSRDSYEKFYFPGYHMKTLKVEKEYPGPGSYTVTKNKSMGTEGRNYTLKSRVKNF